MCFAQVWDRFEQVWVGFACVLHRFGAGLSRFEQVSLVCCTGLAQVRAGSGGFRWCFAHVWCKFEQVLLPLGIVWVQV